MKHTDGSCKYSPEGGGKRVNLRSKQEGIHHEFPDILGNRVRHCLKNTETRAGNSAKEVRTFATPHTSLAVTHVCM